MKLSAGISVIYFPLVLVYMLYGSAANIYWVNAYWLLTSVYFMLIFVDIRRLCINVTHKRIITTVAAYWLVKAGLRLYLFTNMDVYKKVISDSNTFTISGVVIIVLLIYLTIAVKWSRK